jgi:hypothetical protein
MLGTVVMGIDDEHFEEPLKVYKQEKATRATLR